MGSSIQNAVNQILAKLAAIISGATPAMTKRYAVQAQPFNAKAVDGSSDTLDCAAYADLGFTITDAVCDGVLTITDGFGAPLSFIKDNVVVTSFTGASSGTNYHHCLVANEGAAEIIFILTGRTIGSMSVDTNFA